MHARTIDHLPVTHKNWYIRWNAKVAVWVTVGVGSMTCARIFAAIAIAGLPTSLKPNNIGLLFWISSDFLQLTPPSVIIVGQNIQAMAAGARAAKTFEDAEQAKADFQQAKADLITALETPQEACHLGQVAVPSGRTRKHSTADNTYARLDFGRKHSDRQLPRGLLVT